MATPIPTRDRILDAFEELLNDGGERGATLDAVAARAQVSKGGLLYHFASKDALIEGHLARLRLLADDDTERIRSASDGVVDYLIRTSVNAGTPFDRAFLAASCLAQGAHPTVREGITAIRANWLAVIEEAVGDAAVANVILLVSDGLYANSAIVGPHDRQAGAAVEMDGVLAVLRRLTHRD